MLTSFQITYSIHYYSLGVTFITVEIDTGNDIEVLISTYMTLYVVYFSGVYLSSWV